MSNYDKTSYIPTQQEQQTPQSKEKSRKNRFKSLAMLATRYGLMVSFLLGPVSGVASAQESKGSKLSEQTTGQEQEDSEPVYFSVTVKGNSDSLRLRPSAGTTGAPVGLVDAHSDVTYLADQVVQAGNLRFVRLINDQDLMDALEEANPGIDFSELPLYEDVAQDDEADQEVWLAILPSVTVGPTLATPPDPAGLLDGHEAPTPDPLATPEDDTATEEGVVGEELTATGSPDESADLEPDGLNLEQLRHPELATDVFNEFTIEGVRLADGSTIDIPITERASLETFREWDYPIYYLDEGGHEVLAEVFSEVLKDQLTPELRLVSFDDQAVGYVPGTPIPRFSNDGSETYGAEEVTINIEDGIQLVRVSDPREVPEFYAPRITDWDGSSIPDMAYYIDPSSGNIDEETGEVNQLIIYVYQGPDILMNYNNFNDPRWSVTRSYLNLAAVIEDHQDMQDADTSTALVNQWMSKNLPQGSFPLMRAQDLLSPFADQLAEHAVLYPNQDVQLTSNTSN